MTSQDLDTHVAVERSSVSTVHVALIDSANLLVRSDNRVRQSSPILISPRENTPRTFLLQIPWIDPIAIESLSRGSDRTIFQIDPVLSK